MLADAFVDIVLTDLQYVPAVLTPDKVEGARCMVELIDRVATDAG